MSEERGKDSLSKMSLSEKLSERSDSHVSSSVSVKSDRSKGGVPNFSEKTPSSTKSERSGSHVSSSVSMRTDRSKDGDQSKFSEETPSPTKRLQYETLDSDLQTQGKHKNFTGNLLDLESKIINYLKNELDKFKKILQKDDIGCLVKDFNENRCNIKEAALDLTLHYLREMKQDEAADTLEDELNFIHQLKCGLKKKYQCVFEGIAKHGDSTLLNNIYTDLYITQGCSEQVNTEHEVRQIEVASRHHESQEIPVQCTNLFEAPEQQKEVRTVLTKGVAGIGKSVSVQKFVLDWAEGKENQDINFIFPLPFREMNLKEKETQSLMDLISTFFTETKGLSLTRRNRFKVLFILDGLDECRLPLNFDGNETWRDVSSPASLDVLLTNLIKGNLFPSALIWITTRPAAASKIPPDCIDRVTEIRGFNDTQKEEYFKRRFTDENQANEIIDHVKQSKSLFIMCHIPVFCWISATVLQNILEEKRNKDKKHNQSDEASKTLQESNTEDTPKTLTQMYTHFLRFQIQQSSRKYDGEYTPDVSWDEDAILSLGKLAFHQLERNNLIFYDTDLEDCGIDVYKASVYSGMCTQIFKEETGITVGTTFCFVHLSIQEFIAGLYAHLFQDINKKSVFNQESAEEENNNKTMVDLLKILYSYLILYINKKSGFIQEATEQENKNKAMIDLLKTAVDKALESEIGHLDLFLRFLLGLSLQSNRRLLRGLLTQQEDNDQSKKEIVQYIKQKFEDNLSPERSINLFYCLNELNDQSLVKEIQIHFREGSLSSADLSPAQWSALAFVLLTSEEEMEEFELQKFKKSDECFFRLLEVVKISKRALLNDCDLTDKSCSSLAKALNSDNNLEEMNMNNNNLQDSGVIHLSSGLKSLKCKLEILRLSQCAVTEESCSALASVLRSASSSLKDLDLSINNLNDSGVKLLSDGLKENCKLEKLGLSNCSIKEEGYKALASALRSNPSHLIELDLTGNDPGQTGVKELNDLLQDPNCQLKTLRFLGPAADEACQYVNRVVGKNPLLLRELNLSGLELEDSNVKKLAALLQDRHCKLNILQLNNNSITEEGCSALTSAFNSNPSNLIELDLSGNKLGNSGIMSICPLLENTQCRLEKLKLSDCRITEEGYKALASALRSNPSHLIELDLTGNDPGQSGVKELNDLIQDPKFQLKTLRFLGPAADEACQDLNRVVGKNLLLLRELNLSGHKLEDSNVKKLAALLQDRHCKLNILQLNNNSITAEGCAALTSAFNLNPSNLIELDLSGNKLGHSGIMSICPLLENTQCRLEKLKLSDCRITEEGYKALASALRSNPSHLIELDLTGNDPGQSGVKELLDVAQKPDCKLTPIFLKSPAALEVCEYLTEVLGKSPLLLTELDLSEDKLGDLDGEKLSALLMDSHSKVEKIKLNNYEMTKKSCAVLATVLSKNTILKEMDLNNSRLLDSGVKEICEGLKTSKLKILKLSNCSITEEGYKALASALRSNPSHLIELDLTGNDPGQSGVKELNNLLQDQNCQLKTLRFLAPAADEACQYVRGIVGKNLLLLRELNLSDRELGDSNVKNLVPLLQEKHCKLNTLMLRNCGLTEESCSALATVLRSNSSLNELDMSNNNLQDSGVKKLQKGLENTNCRLQKLRLSDCRITEEGYKALASALRSNPSHLIELDLTGNDPGQSGVKELNDLIQDPKFQLKTLRFLGPAADEACQYLTGIVGKNLLLLRELNLSEHKLEDSNVKKLAALLQDRHCQLNTLQLNNNSITEEGCSALTSAVNSNPSNLIELDLSGNKLGNSGIMSICPLLKNTQCRLEKLKLSNCSITEEGYKALASALRSNPSHLIELDLTGNDPGQSGVKELLDVAHKPDCKLTPIFFKSPAALEACEYLTKVLGKSPLLLTELDLSGDKLGDLDGEKLSALLMDSHSKVEKMKLNNYEMTKKSCAVLATVLSKNTTLKEMDLNNSRLLDSGVKEICKGLKNSKLKILKLSKCRITEEGYKALASALRSNSSHLIELDLTGNDPGQSGVKELNDLLQDPNCQLKTLRFLGPAAEEACQYVTGIVGENPLLLRELNLSDRELGDTRVNQIYALLQDKHCKLNTLNLCGCSITEKQCVILTSALKSNPSHLRELDLSRNKLGDSGVKNLSDLLMNPQCKLEKLHLCECSITEKQCLILTSALKSNPSHLRELNLNKNQIKNTGVNHLCDILKDSHCKLERLWLSNCDMTDEGCSAVTSALKSNPPHLRQLDLSGNEIRNTGVKHLCDVLKDSHCKLERLRLGSCEMTDEGCSAVTSALKSNPSHLRELDLIGNKLGDSGVKNLSDLLMNPQCKLEKLHLWSCSITEKQCLILTSALKSNPSHLRELDLRINEIRNTGVNHLCDVLKDSHCKLERLSLGYCKMTDEGCSAVTSALKSNPSHLRELDLSENKLGDSGVKNLSDLLMNPQCKLEKLELSDCRITEEGFKALASALRSNPSHLIELDLTGNDPGQSGVKELNDLLQDQNCQLETLRFLGPAADEACQYVRGIVGKSPLLLRYLDLSGHELGDTRVNQISALLQDKHCKLNTLNLCKCSITEKQCLILTSALKSNPSHLRKLNLSVNEIRNTGVNNLCDVLKDSHCKLERLSLGYCKMTDEGCSAVTSALKSNPSHLRELDLIGNKLGDSGVKNLSDLLMIPQCKLEKLDLLSCSITEKQCLILTSALKSNPSHLRELILSWNEIRNTGVNHLGDVLKDSLCKLEILRLSGCKMTDGGCSPVTSALKSNPSHLRELNLSRNKLGDSGVKNLSDLLMSPQCKLEKLWLWECSITEKQCLILTSALKSNPSHLRKLILSENKIENTGVNHLCDLLKDSHCKLEILRLSNCSITEEGYKALASALRSNPSHLIELDLTGNYPGQSGVKELNDLLQDPKFQLKTLRVLSPAAEAACQYVTGILGKSLLFLRELNLSGHELGDTRVNQISALLQDKHCKLNTLNLCGCSITEKQCLILTSALKSNPSHLRELDLSINKIENTGVNHLCDILKDSHCKLEILRLSCCNMTGEGCSAVTSALKSNPSHLRELELSGNKLGDSGVKNLSDLLMNPQCKLEKLHLRECSITEKQCLILTSALKSNPSHLRKLNLRKNKIENTGVNHLCDVLKDSHCKLERLSLNDCGITDVSALTQSLTNSNALQFLKELDLRNNMIRDSKQLRDVIRDSNCTLR
ncbi:hypothetical protein PO909_027873 [Leuciscus waleckii]